MHFIQNPISKSKEINSDSVLDNSQAAARIYNLGVDILISDKREDLMFEFTDCLGMKGWKLDDFYRLAGIKFLGKIWGVYPMWPEESNDLETAKFRGVLEHFFGLMPVLNKDETFDSTKMICEIGKLVYSRNKVEPYVR